MPCLKCGGSSEEDALLCDGCADTCFKETRFFLNPVLIGNSVFSKMRSEGSAALLLGPVCDSDIIKLPSADLPKMVNDMPTEGIKQDDLAPFFERCNALLSHLGVPLNLDGQTILLTNDAAEAIASVVKKVDSVEQMLPQVATSDMYIKLGVVYWSASRGILFRTASKKWREDKKRYLIGKAKDYFAKVSPKDELYSIAARNLGLLSVDAQEWAGAESYLSDALRHFPSDQKISEGLAKALIALGNQIEALSKVDESLAVGDSANLWVLKGRVLRGMGRGGEALDCFNKALAIDSMNSEANALMISTLRELGRVEEAVLAERRRMLSRKPGIEQKIADLVNMLEKESKAEAVPAAPKVEPQLPRPAERRLKAEPPKPAPPSATPIQLAKQSLAAKDYDGAIQKAEHILEGAPDSREAHLVLIEALVAKGDLKVSAAKTHLFYDKNRNDPLAWYWRGVIAEKEDKWGAAVQYLSKAVTLDPKLVHAWIVMGETLMKNKKLNGADESFSRAIQIDGDSPQAWLGKAHTMRDLGRWGAAIQCLDRYNQLAPGDSAAWRMKADILFEKEKYRRAIDAYDKFLNLSQDDSYALSRKGIALNALGMTDEALRCLEESVRLDPNNKEAVKWLRAISSSGGES